MGRPCCVQDLRDDPDEMLQGVDWGKVARFVDLSEELTLFEGPGGGAAGGTGTSGGRGAAAGAPALDPSGPQQLLAGGSAPQQDTQWAGQRGSEGRSSAPHQHAAVAGDAAAMREDELFESAGWAAPSLAAEGSARSRRAEALADLGWVCV